MDWLSVSKPLVATVWLAILWTLESAVPMYGGRDRRISHGMANLGLGLLNTLVVALPFATLMDGVTQWARAEDFGLIRLAALPTWLSWMLMLVLFDAWMYMWHRLNHRIPLLWRFHAVHHTDREMDATSALRFHTGEIIFSSAARLMVLPLLGMTMPQLLAYELLLLPVILFHHSNVRVPREWDTMLRYLIVTPWMHWVHHSRERVETNSNYAGVLSVWDRMFGTYRFRADPETIQQGLRDEDGGARWRTLLQMLLSPFVQSTTRAELP
jgi:sterol desaturase/sphingolipid hydroxylase (fatty acid hydroxylase superfamily)